jgi:hypothetical protein
MFDNVQKIVDRFSGLTAERVRRSLSVRTMRAIGRVPAVRTVASYGYHARGAVQSRLFPGIDVDTLESAVRRDGFCQGLKLPPEILSELLAFTESTPCYADRNPALGYLPRDRQLAEKVMGTKFTLGGYFNTYDACPAVRQIANDPLVRELALRYVGPRAQHLGTNIWWSYANDLPRSKRHEFAQLFHFDLDDYKFIKFFFYLTDVDLQSGPHVYVRGTHARKQLRHVYPMRRLEDEDVSRTYGAHNIVAIEGRAGEGFCEDTFGLHKGAPPLKRDRLVLQFEYAISQGYTDDRCDPALLKRLELKR